jgi:hypothetical protein
MITPLFAYTAITVTVLLTGDLRSRQAARRNQFELASATR